MNTPTLHVLIFESWCWEEDASARGGYWQPLSHRIVGSPGDEHLEVVVLYEGVATSELLDYLHAVKPQGLDEPDFRAIGFAAVSGKYEWRGSVLNVPQRLGRVVARLRIEELGITAQPPALYLYQDEKGIWKAIEDGV